MLESILQMTMAITGGIGASATYEILRYLLGDKTKEETIDQRIRRLSSSLIEAANLISQIETEIASRQALAEKLKNDIKIYEQITSLKQSEIEAVTQVLRKELKNENRRSFRDAVIVDFVFFVVGAGFSFILTMIF